MAFKDLYLLNQYLMFYPTVPGELAELQFWNTTFSSLEMEWTPPSTPNGKIVKYEIAYQEENPEGEWVGHMTLDFSHDVACFQFNITISSSFENKVIHITIKSSKQTVYTNVYCNIGYYFNKLLYSFGKKMLAS